jgi:hypothetical protein
MKIFAAHANKSAMKKFAAAYGADENVSRRYGDREIVSGSALETAAKEKPVFRLFPQSQQRKISMP